MNRVPEPKNYQELIPYIARERDKRCPYRNAPAMNTTEATRAFGKKVKELRTQHKVDVFDLSRASGLDVRLLALIEKELARPDEITPKVLEILASLLGNELRTYQLR